VKALLRGFGLASSLVLFLGLSGCGTDNESEAEKAQKSLGPIPTTTAKPGQATPPPASYSERKPPDAMNPEYKKEVGGARK
jgi:hypothetical protein